MGSSAVACASYACTEEFRNYVVLIGVIVAFCGVVVAVISVLATRATARKKQSADLLFSSRGDKELQEGARQIEAHCTAKDKNIGALIDSFDGNECKAVRYVLNHFETVSVGIQSGIYDEKMIKDCWYGMVIGTYDRSFPLIQAIRQRKGKTVLQEYEWLVVRWKSKPLVARQKH